MNSKMSALPALFTPIFDFSDDGVVGSLSIFFSILRRVALFVCLSFVCVCVCARLNVFMCERVPFFLSFVFDSRPRMSRARK